MSKTMLDIFKERLPEGLSIVNIQDRTGCNQIKMKMAYKNYQTDGYLQKTCAPGYENFNCDFSISAIMIDIALKSENLEMAKVWLEKQKALTSKN